MSISTPLQCVDISTESTTINLKEVHHPIPQPAQNLQYTRSQSPSFSLSPFIPSNNIQRTPRPSNSYQRPTGPEIVRPHIPSCSSLPQHWCPIHDRFIAYLATHAPLTESGRVPDREELRERWKTEDIARLVIERFPRLGGEVSFLSFLGGSGQSGEIGLIWGGRGLKPV
jgi:hypothetical protein